jgi:multidrug efflux pump subunit AcrA (membrane-fusion protein)
MMATEVHRSAGDRLAELFPGPDAPTTRRPWWRSRRIVVAAVVVVVVVTTVFASQAFGSSGPAYQTAVVGRRSLAATLTGTATIQPVSQANVAFPISGTVAAVNVNVGDTVTVGQPLASLDPASLLADLASKQQALTQAQLTLDNALSGQSGSSGGGSGGTSGSGGTGLTGGTGSSSGTGGTGSSGSSGATNASLSSFRSGSTPSARFISVQSTSTDPEIAAAQQAVIAAQHAVDVAIATADNALQTATTMCAPIGSDPSTPPTQQQVSACEQALTVVQTAQRDVQDKENTLADALNKLDNLLQQQANQPPPTTTPPTTTPPTTTPPATTPPATSSPSGSASGRQSAPSGAAGAGGGAQPRTGAGGGAGGGARAGGGSSPSAADLAADQQAVDAAAADVAVSEQALNQATIGSPIDGTVVAVNLNVGDTVSAASSSANIVVQGDGGYEVATTVSVDRVGQVAVGQGATLVPDGGHRPFAGKVAYVSVVPTTSSTTSGATSTYLVIVGLDKSDASLENGSTGTVSIVTGSAAAALAVPTSAVTTFGNRHTVEVLDGGTIRRVAVTVGAVGDTWTEIKSGLSAGEQVVLANASEPLPSSATQSVTQNGADGFPNGFRFGGGTSFPSGRRVGG